MPQIHHCALYVCDLEAAKNFYCKYFGGSAGEMYHNPRTGLKSYFLSFGSGARLELMNRPEVATREKGLFDAGYIHLSFCVGGKEQVDALTETLRADGYEVVGEPRTTGDGFYESCIRGAENDLIEIVAE